MPFQLSTRGRYGVRLMVALALAQDGPSLLKEVARREGISEKYLGQIIIPLKAAGLVSSQRGSRGGYSLAKPSEDITVRDVVEAIEGRIFPAPGMDDAAGPARATEVVVAGVWRIVRDEIEGSLSRITLAALARQAREVGDSTESYVI